MDRKGRNNHEIPGSKRSMYGYVLNYSKIQQVLLIEKYMTGNICWPLKSEHSIQSFKVLAKISQVDLFLSYFFFPPATGNRGLWDSHLLIVSVQAV